MRWLRSLILLTAVLWFGRPAFAAEQKTKTLPPVEVVGKEVKTSLTVPTGSEAAQNLKRVPGATALVNAEDYKTGRSSTVQDALAFAPGVYAKSRFGAEETRLSIRGSGIQRTFHLRGIKLLQDGVPINQADGGGDFQFIDPLALAYTEVYRGANALQYGSSTLGGAINFVSPTGYDAPLAQGRLEIGSNNYIRSQVSSGAVVGPAGRSPSTSARSRELEVPVSADYYVSLSHFYQDGFRNHSDQDTKRFFSNYGLRMTDQLETRFYVSAMDSRSKLPGNLTKAQMRQNPAQPAPLSESLNQKRDFDLVRIANKTTLQLDEQSVELDSYFIRKDLYHPISPIVDDVSDDFGFSLRYKNEMNVLGHKNRVIAGITPSFGAISATRSTNVGGVRGAQTAQSRQRAFNVETFAEEQFYILPQLAIVSGLQWTYASRAIHDRFTPDGDNSGHPVYKQASPKAGLIYDLTERSQLYTNFSRSFEPPSFAELSNVATGGIRDIHAQMASTVEFGTRGSEGRVSWDAAWYYSWVENELLSLNDGAGVALGTINAGQTRHQGVELGSDIVLWKGILERWKVEGGRWKEKEEREKKKEKKIDRIKVRASYLWNRFRFNNDQAFSNNPLPGIPEHFLRAELVYEHPSGLYFGPNLEWSMKRYSVDMANTLFADGYATLGVKGGYRTKRGISFFVEGRNLTNEIYANTTGVTANAAGRDSAQFLPGDARSVYAGVEVRWG